MTKEGFEAREVVRLVRIPERALRYWADRRVVVPAIADAVGRPGKRRRYSFDNLVECAIVDELFAYGINLREATNILKFIKRSLFFTHAPRQFYVVIQEGEATGAYFYRMQRQHKRELQRRYPKWLKELEGPKEKTFGDYLEQIMAVHQVYDSLLIVAVHRIRDRLAERVGKEKIKKVIFLA